MIEFELTVEINELGVTKVLENDGSLYVYNGKSFTKSRFYKNELQKTLDELKEKMIYDGCFGDEKAVIKIVKRLSDIWINSDENKNKQQFEGQEKEQKKSAYEKTRSAEIEAIKTEINRVKNANTEILEEKWKIRLVERYNELCNAVNMNIPEIWPGLEFELSSLRILNIYECDLPFIGIILGRPSSYKTIVINLLKPWYCTFYTDSFSPKAWVTHTTAVDSEAELMKIDMLPKVKDRHFLTPELAPIFTNEEKDLGLILGTITRIADGHGYGNDSGAHGHRQYGNTMFVWTGGSCRYSI